MRRSAPLLLSLLLVACGSQPPAAHHAASRFDPARFVARVDNPWFPLPPGTTLRYRGGKDGRGGVDLFTVTHRTRTILGVRATVVHDRVITGGRLAEDTYDYYAQDEAGNVWYLGEDTRELDRRGRVTSREGTWRAGRGGARAGIFMPADPRVGETHRQEIYPGHAEDHFRVAARTARRLRTTEWTPLEPGVLDAKHYARGIGTVLEQTVRGGRERWVLASVRRGG
jgi:hypothetical protein